MIRYLSSNIIVWFFLLLLIFIIKVNTNADCWAKNQAILNITKMIDRNKLIDYRRYCFFDRVPLISCKDQIRSYLENKFASINIDTDEIKDVIETTIENIMETDFGNNFQEVHRHIDEAKDDVNSNFQNLNNHIEEAKDHLCCDICCAKNDIKRYIDDKIDPINFQEQFSNLNEQVVRILNKIDNN